MPNADLNITVRGRTPILRADIIRRDTILAIARALREEPTGRRLIDALDELGEIDIQGAYEGEIDSWVESIETLAEMDHAEMELTGGDLDQLARQAADAVNELTPSPVTELLPRQQERRAS